MRASRVNVASDAEAVELSWTHQEIGFCSIRFGHLAAMPQLRLNELSLIRDGSVDRGIDFYWIELTLQ
jgi:hypothetical protein